MMHTFMQENEIEIRSENDILWCNYISAGSIGASHARKKQKKKRERENFCVAIDAS